MAVRPRVALVYPTTIRPDAFFGYLLPPLGLERLAAAIEDLADVEIFDARFEADVVAAVARSRPDVVGLTIANTLTSAEGYAVADALRAALPGARVVLGGLHVTSCPEEAMDHADFLVRGEGEGPFRALVAGEDPLGIPGLVHRGPAAEVVRNPMAPPRHDLDALRPPARHLRKPAYRYAAAGLLPMDMIESSRGCTHACSFCSPATVYPHRWRAHSPAYVVAEIQRLAAAGVKLCMLTDDHFGGDHARAERICDLVIASGVKMAFFCFVRAFAGNMALKRKMVRAGFVLVTYGAESPSPDQLRRYKKGYPTESGAFLRQVNAEWREAGACYVGNSYVFGDVQDTAASLAALGAYARRLDPTYIEPLYAQPYPDTAYRRELEAKGLVLPKAWSQFTEGRLLLAHPELDEAQLRRLRARVWVDFFSPRKAAAGLLKFPLHLHRELGVPVPTVLRYLWAVRYSVFGCFLEEKYYRDLQVEMVRDWFRRAVGTFEPAELDFGADADAFAEMLGLGPLKRLLGDAELVVEVVEGTSTLASVVVGLARGRVARAAVVPGAAAPAPGVRRLATRVPLDALAEALGGETPARQAAGAARLAAALPALNVPALLGGRHGAA